MKHSSNIKPMSEHSETEKSVKLIVFGNLHELFGKNRQKNINMHNKSTLTYFKTSLAAYKTNEMSHFSHHCMHMAARAHANEMLMRLDRSLDKNLSFIIFVKLRSRF